MNNDDDLRLQETINAGVEADLGGRRQPPAFYPERKRSASRGSGVAAWRAPLIGAAIVGGLIIATTLAVRHSVGTESSGMRVSTAAAPSSPVRALGPARLTALGIGSIRGDGINGQSTWAIGANGLAISVDGGTTWASDPLPDGVTAAAVLSVSAPTAGTLVLAAPTKNGFTLYRQSGASPSWSGVTLTPSWPRKTKLTGPPDGLIYAQGPNNIVFAVASIGVGSSDSATAVFISTDGGQTYAQHDPAGFTFTVDSIGFTSATNAVAIEGPTSELMFRTTDGGTTWTQVTVQASDPGSQTSFGQPTVNGQNIEVSKTVLDSSYATHISFLRSDDGGASFTAEPTDQTLTVPANQDGVQLGQVSSTRWVIPAIGRVLYASNSDGGSWTTINSATLPKGVVSVDMSSPEQATVITSTGSCTGIKTGCSNLLELYATSDGGHTWTAD
jgi:hypothetical protein